MAVATMGVLEEDVVEVCLVEVAVVAEEEDARLLILNQEVTTREDLEAMMGMERTAETTTAVEEVQCEDQTTTATETTPVEAGAMIIILTATVNRCTPGGHRLINLEEVEATAEDQDQDKVLPRCTPRIQHHHLPLSHTATLDTGKLNRLTNEKRI